MNRKALTTMITFPLEDIGLMAEDMWPVSGTKHHKAAHFRRLRKMLCLFSILQAKDEIHAIGVAMSPDGTIVGHVSFIPAIRSEK